MFEERGYFSIIFQEADNRFIQSGEGFITVVLTGVVYGTAVEYKATTVATGILRDTFFICKTGDLYYKAALLEIVSKLFQLGKFFQHMAEVRIFGIGFLQ